MARAVTVIPPTIQPITHLARNAVVRRRVAAYARVSTSSEEQLTKPRWTTTPASFSPSQNGSS